ncbi:C3a anaphylatoxin chemotactic receptor-like [Hemitrygon akajei]|uniref:C3a anaphylatoxin chemotactic receptor-like n=1 Tax=Hemitrygon akajei TaxID=2704970 RepID=UPI003BF9F41D
MEWGAASVTSMVIFTLTFLLGVPGNGTVIWVIVFKMKSNVHTECFLTLALTDLIYCLTLPFRMANISLTHSGYNAYFSCKFIGILMFLDASASTYLLFLISICRCLDITRPPWFQQYLSLTWSLDPSLRRVPACPPASGFEGGIDGWRLQGNRFAKYQKPVRLIITVVVAFMICWIPNAACDLLSAFTTPISQDWSSFTVALASCNSAINPLLYVFAGREFHQVFRRSILASLRLAFAEQSPEMETQSRTPNFTIYMNV